MKDILFRGKRIDNGEWVEGYYFCVTHTDGRHSHHFIMPLGTDLSLGTLIEDMQVEVDHETVCRCTGKEYMDSEIAYEGDIFVSQVSGDLMILRFGTYQAYCPVDRCYMDSVGFYAECTGYSDMPIGDLHEYALKKGTIFDNFELLKGAQDNEGYFV